MNKEDRRELMKDVQGSFRESSSQDPIVAKTPEAALAVATTYIMATTPAENDPRAPLQRVAMDNMAVLKETLKEKEAGGAARRRSPPRNTLLGICPRGK